MERAARHRPGQCADAVASDLVGACAKSQERCMISVVIPTFNSAEFVGGAIDSVLAQTFCEWELIIVDDGSSDEGASIVRRYRDPRISLIQQPNSGVSAARNRGILAARNDLVALLDADDLWMPDHLSTIGTLARRFPRAVLYCAANICFMAAGE